MVLLAEDEEGMAHMMGKLEGYLEEKRLEVNVEKTKVMRFRRGGKVEKNGLVVKREKGGGGEGFHVSRIQVATEWRAGGTRRRELRRQVR
ncbi:hypothetical protein RF55_23446 [Lasius niger]|uniref:Reverse transcriptase domain-containing protein n=1 Tax=Lasius niger TaxID=67767 RepID=A0A0J7JVZ3_LASNI|nr:hypothetical protein RF55_23446 [Lasius niger]